MQLRNEVRVRVLMSHFLSDIALWAYVKPSAGDLDRLVGYVSTALSLADAETVAHLQTLIAELEQVRRALLRSESLQDSHLAAKRMGVVVKRIRDGSLGEVQVIEVMELVGASVIYVETISRSGILVGQVAAFKRAGREDKEWLIADVVLRPADEQQALTELFRDLYLSADCRLQANTFYRWPADFPSLTFHQSDKQLVRIRWKRMPSVKRARASIRSLMPFARDGRIGMRVYHAHQERGGHLKGRMPGETWIVAGDEGTVMINHSSQFWLLAGEKGETIAEEDPLLLKARRVLDEQALSDILGDALRLHKRYLDSEVTYEVTEGINMCLSLLLDDVEALDVKTNITMIFRDMLQNWQKDGIAAETARTVSRMRGEGSF